MTPKHGLLFFITSCLSGCGQMYQGYMKRGLSLLLFFVILAVSGFLGRRRWPSSCRWCGCTRFSTATISVRRSPPEHSPADDFLFGLSDLDSQRMAKLLRSRHSLIGWALILVAAGCFTGCS